MGRGRNAQDPYRGLISDEGKVEIPIDRRPRPTPTRGIEASFDGRAAYDDANATIIRATLVNDVVSYA